MIRATANVRRAVCAVLNLARARGLAGVGAALALPIVAVAQQTRVVQVQVTAVGGNDLFVDAGRSQGLEPGMIVRLFPPGAAVFEAEVRSVSGSSARLVPVGGGPLPPVGTRGEVEVREPSPSSAPSAPTSTQPRPAVPDHPPWQRGTEPLGADDPLLAWSRGPKSCDRPMTIDGRMFGTGQWSRDTGAGRDDEYLLARLGVHSEVHNAVGLGEEILFSGEVDDRATAIAGRPDEQNATARIDQLSMALGTEGFAPLGVEAGRMRSRHLPEIGLLDGVEGVARFQHGLRLGGGFGAYPRPFPARATGEDLQAHLFFDYDPEDHGAFAAALGVQKTWHEGTADRDLVIVRAESRPADGVWLFASAKIDWYTRDDVRKSRGFEVTELLAQARWDGVNGGAGAQVSHFAWPDLLRREYQLLPDDLVRDGRVDRVSLSGWRRLKPDVRATVRGDYWQDQDRDGTSIELGGDFDNAFLPKFALGATVFYNDGGFQSGPGARLLLRRSLGDVQLRAGYRWYRYRLDSLIVEPETMTRQSADVGVSWSVGDFDFDFAAERWFGDGQDAFVLALYSQWRF